MTASTELADDTPRITMQGLLAKTERAVHSVVEFAAAMILVAEIAILSCGVIARYVFSAPFTWTDELASILFLWLGTLGATIALNRAAHMRMTTFAMKASPRVAEAFHIASLTICMTFVAAIAMPAFDYVRDDAFIVTPALEISSAWRSSALLIGALLMLVNIFFQLTRSKGKSVFWSLLFAVVCVGALYGLRGSLISLGNINLVIFFLLLVAAGVGIGSPIAFVFGLSAFAYVSLATKMPLLILAGRLDEGMSNPVLLAIPLFVFLGLLMEMGGFAGAMLGFLGALLRRVRGGLSYVLIGAMYLVSGISGSKTADMAALAPGLFPEMEKRGAKRGDLVALLAATGAQTETIPPSFVLITTGSVTGVSIASLFTGGMLPALVVGLCLCTVVWYRNRNEDIGHIPRISAGEITKALAVASPALALPFLIRAAIIEGVATATEVSVIGIFYVVLVAVLVYRHFEFKRIYPMLIATASLSGAILLINGAATTIAWSLTQSGFSHDLATFILGLPGGAFTFLAVSILMFIILGTVLEGLPCIVLFAPLMFPIAKAVGVDVVHYSMVVILSMGIGLFLPPFGVGYYAACAVAQVDPNDGLKPIVGYKIALLIGVILVAVFPWLSTGFLDR